MCKYFRVGPSSKGYPEQWRNLILLGCNPRFLHFHLSLSRVFQMSGHLETTRLQPPLAPPSPTLCFAQVKYRV